MIKYEFMRAHGKGSEGSEKRGGAKIKRGCEKKGGARSTGTPPVYATDQNGSQNRWDGGDKYYFVHTTIPRHVCPK